MYSLHAIRTQLNPTEDPITQVGVAGIIYKGASLNCQYQVGTEFLTLQTSHVVYTEMTPQLVRAFDGLKLVLRALASLLQTQ
jgi:hypothetical protein